MEEYSIFFKKSVEKDLKTIPQKYLLKILEKIEILKDNPRPEGCEKLTGLNRYRIRQGMYRVVYSIQDNELTVWVIRVAHRKEVYTRLS